MCINLNKEEYKTIEKAIHTLREPNPFHVMAEEFEGNEMEKRKKLITKMVENRNRDVRIGYKKDEEVEIEEILSRTGWYSSKQIKKILRQ